MQRFVLGVDLDGVVADFYGGLKPIAAEWLGVDMDLLTDDVTYGLPEWNLASFGKDGADAYEKMHHFAVTEKDLFSILAPIPRAPVVLRRLAFVHDVRIRIITHRLFIKNRHQLAIQQTTDWLDKHGIPYWDLCFMKDKAAVGADLYIEDAPKNVEALREDGHQTIVFTNSTNKGIAGPRANNWDEAEALVLEEVARWKGSGKANKHTSGN